MQMGRHMFVSARSSRTAQYVSPINHPRRTSGRRQRAAVGHGELRRWRPGRELPGRFVARRLPVIICPRRGASRGLWGKWRAHASHGPSRHMAAPVFFHPALGGGPVVELMYPRTCRTKFVCQVFDPRLLIPGSSAPEIMRSRLAVADVGRVHVG